VIRGNRPEQAAKAMVLDVRGGGGGGARARHPAGQPQARLRRRRRLFEARKCGFASPKSAQALTGCAMGAVPPFSLNPDLAIVVDEDLLANDTLFFNAGRLDRSMELDTGTGSPSPAAVGQIAASLRSTRAMNGWKRELQSIAWRSAWCWSCAPSSPSPIRVPSGSMVPTLLVGDELIGSQVRLRLGQVLLADRPDAGLLRPACSAARRARRRRGLPPAARSSRTYVKRVIGLPGDRIQLRGGRLYINDAMVPRRAAGTFGRRPALCRDAAQRARARDRRDLRRRPLRRHAGLHRAARHYFMMGDNRDNSLDSRDLPADGGVGFVPEENLVARADRLLFSPTRRSAGSTSATGRTPSGWRASSAASTDREAGASARRCEADFEPLLALRIDVMREHLERVFRYKPSRARRIFREHFDEPACA
jgi:signal peptidase I